MKSEKRITLLEFYDRIRRIRIVNFVAGAAKISFANLFLENYFTMQHEISIIGTNSF